jgi:hypothetical protein
LFHKPKTKANKRLQAIGAKARLSLSRDVRQIKGDKDEN